MRTSYQKGFIALISVIVMSVVLLTTTLSLAQFGIAGRFFILDLENKQGSRKLAEACAYIARIRVYNDPMYTLARHDALTIPIDTTSCTILSVTHTGHESTIETKGVRGNSVTNLRVVVDTRDGGFLSWMELPTL